MRVASQICLLVLPAIASAQGSPKIHELKASPTTVHRGFFDASLKPVLTIDSGDVVRLETATGNPRWFEKLGVPRDKIPAELYEVFQGVEGDGRGDHTLNGPIAIRGAEPGDTLEIRIRSVDVRLPIAGQSFAPNRGLLPDEFPYEKSRVTWIDVDRKVVQFAPGIEFPAKPFWGVMGVAPPAGMGRVPSGPPNVFGGILDNRDLGSGSAARYISPSTFPARSCLSAMATPCRGTVRSVCPPWRPHSKERSKSCCTRDVVCDGRAPKRRRTTSPWDLIRISTKPRGSRHVRCWIFWSKRRG